jgi:hypothetical protein
MQIVQSREWRDAISFREQIRLLVSLLIPAGYVPTATDYLFTIPDSSTIHHVSQDPTVIIRVHYLSFSCTFSLRPSLRIKNSQRPQNREPDQIALIDIAENLITQQSSIQTPDEKFPLARGKPGSLSGFISPRLSAPNAPAFHPRRKISLYSYQTRF